MFNARTIGANDPPEAVPIECGRAGSDRMPHRKKRLLILSEIISPYRIPVFNALARHDCVDLRVVFLAETDAGLRQWPVYKGEIRFPYEVLRSWRFRARKHNLLLNWGLRSCLRSFAPEVVICGGYNYFASWDALWWARRHSAELVLWSESNRYDDRRGLAWVELMKAHFLARCDRFVVPGIASFAYLQSLGSAPEHITVAPNAVDNGWFAAKSDIVRVHAQDFREKLDLPPRFVLFVGRLVPEKGVFDLLDAYGRLGDDIRTQTGLVFAGTGVSKAELEEQAKRIGTGRICFPGFVEREDLAGLYALADALIMPTHSDPWGLVVNEAMACRLPIVVTSVAGCSADLVEDGWNGYVVPPRNPERLSAALDSVIRNVELTRQMSVRSTERIRDYSPEACAAGLATAALSAGRQAR